MNNNYIQHAGVKGMKWGVRKARETDTNSKAAKGKAKIGKILAAIGATAVAAVAVGLAVKHAPTVSRALKSIRVKPAKDTHTWRWTKGGRAYSVRRMREFSRTKASSPNFRS